MSLIRAPTTAVAPHYRLWVSSLSRRLTCANPTQCRRLGRTVTGNGSGSTLASTPGKPAAELGGWPDGAGGSGRSPHRIAKTLGSSDPRSRAEAAHRPMSPSAPAPPGAHQYVTYRNASVEVRQMAHRRRIAMPRQNRFAPPSRWISTMRRNATTRPQSATMPLANCTRPRLTAWCSG